MVTWKMLDGMNQREELNLSCKRSRGEEPRQKEVIKDVVSEEKGENQAVSKGTRTSRALLVNIIISKMLSLH